MSLFGGVVIVAGLTGSFIQAILLDKYKKFKYQLLYIGISSLLGVIMVILVVDRGHIWLTSIALAIVGLSVIPIIGVGYSF